MLNEHVYYLVAKKVEPTLVCMEVQRGAVRFVSNWWFAFKFLSIKTRGDLLPYIIAPYSIIPCVTVGCCCTANCKFLRFFRSSLTIMSSKRLVRKHNVIMLFQVDLASHHHPSRPVRCRGVNRTQKWSIEMNSRSARIYICCKNSVL